MAARRTLGGEFGKASSVTIGTVATDVGRLELILKQRRGQVSVHVRDGRRLVTLTSGWSADKETRFLIGYIEAHCTFGVVALAVPLE